MFYHDKVKGRNNMEQQLLHTPEGVRDIYNKECAKKQVVQDRLHHMLHLYGYQDIQTPTFEFFDVFRKEVGTISSRELYKFFDREGNTLALRPDITPSIARAAATLLESEDLPARLCYVGNTFINHSSYQGRLKENTQLGAELIGSDDIESDVEMLAMVVDGLKSVGLEEFQVNIGHVDFIESLMEETGLDAEKQSEIRTLINNRNHFGVDEILDESHVKDSVKDAFHILPELIGSVEVLDQADEIAPNISAKLAISHLRQMYELFTLYGVEDHVSFDLSMSGNYGYYMGIIFRAYTYGTGDAIVRGGRYDHLMEKFGKETPSIGFAIIIDELMSALSRQKIRVDCAASTMVVFTEATTKWGIRLAREFRSKNKNVELVKYTPGKDLEDYKAYAKKNQALSLLILNDDLTITMINILTNEEKNVDCKGTK
ncbi:ATP phosphoribosyltransferase regulatory subunit [Hespellia stercorisuis DSM 15480]|uniref:ATP phosphoribosyltransferase regulatory subunit n=2 Tax=Hespellia stercorisuis TaxID=180311 RepID=A0A1M6S392_9FIRM|nr:ATP phosphoribosyltransferase regulatory subunit [Hespellia stercorisuis DSM 15480]